MELDKEITELVCLLVEWQSFIFNSHEHIWLDDHALWTLNSQFGSIKEVDGEISTCKSFLERYGFIEE
jgi:hypothetical protein